MKYDFAQIEKKWQDIWDKNNTFAASDDYSNPKYYALVEFPYPSCRAPKVLHCFGYCCPQTQNAGLQRAVPHGVGRIWPAYRKLCH